MLKRIAAIVFIYMCTVVGWLVLGGTVSVRTESQDAKLRKAVGQLWGTTQRQAAPSVTCRTEREVQVQTTRGTETLLETKREWVHHDLALESSDVKVYLKLEPRRKGLLWYSTYKVRFEGKYGICNSTPERRDILFGFTFPQKGAVYGDFRLAVGGKQVREVHPASGGFSQGVPLDSGQRETVEVSYESQGLDEWGYDFGSEVTQVRDFSLSMNTDFNKVDFPQDSISPTSKEASGKGWALRWKYSNLLAGARIGMLMPQKLNPGPWVTRVTWSAPVSLFLFLFLMVIITVRRGLDIHPMNYFFVCAAFFAFHLLLAYTVDHLPIHLAFLLSSAVSIGLVVSYMRVVAGNRFAFFEVGLSQFVYLVLFSYTFFFEEYTGLAITVLCILTLFVVMQYTARVDWSRAFARRREMPHPEGTPFHGG